MTCVVYIIFGLALTGLCLNTIQVIQSVFGASEKLKAHVFFFKNELLRTSDNVRNKLCTILGLQLNSNEVVNLGCLRETVLQPDTSCHPEENVPVQLDATDRDKKEQ